MKKIKVHANVRLDAYKIIDDIVYEAIEYGYNRAHKHVDNPSKETMIREVHNSIMNELSEVLKFDDEK